MSDLMCLDQARKALQICIEPLQAKTLRDKAAALEVFARAARDSEMLVLAGEIRLRAERRLGELLTEMTKRQGWLSAVPTGNRGKNAPDGGDIDSHGEPPPKLADLGIDKKLSTSAQKLAAIKAREFEDYLAQCREAGRPPKSAKVLFRGGAARPVVHHSSSIHEYYTPPALVERVRAVFGGSIDLDPCSNEGRPHVPAQTHFTRREDGMKQPWHGNVYCHPPYGGVGDWIDKSLSEHQEGHTDAIILLLSARTDTPWFHALRDFPVCFLRGRVAFVGSGACNPAPFASMLVWVSARDPAVFAASLEGVGNTYARLQ